MSENIIEFQNVCYRYEAGEGEQPLPLCVDHVTLHIKKGDFAGYGANYLAKEDMMVATLPIGYADGISASMKYVSINDKKYEIVGDICMDMTLVKVDKNVKLHDKVEIFGNDISIKSVARNMQSNAYHVLTGITTRVPRIYQDGKEIKY